MYLPHCCSCCILLSCSLLPTVLLSLLPAPLLVSAAHPTTYLGCLPLLLVLLIADCTTHCFPAHLTHHFLPCLSLPACSSLHFPLVTTCDAYHSPSRLTCSLPSTPYLHPCTNHTLYVVPHLNHRCSRCTCAHMLIACFGHCCPLCCLSPCLCITSYHYLPLPMHCCSLLIAVCSVHYKLMLVLCLVPWPVSYLLPPLSH
jgi:hypothetical protein